MISFHKISTFKRNDWFYVAALFVILGYFLFKCFYYASNLKYGIPPDEMMHGSLIEAFSQKFDLFIDPMMITTGYEGVNSQDRFFYHFLLANTIGVFWDISSNLFLFRAFNILITLLNIGTFFCILKLVFKSRAEILFGITIYTNILMFCILSSSISYDNLINLLATSFIYCMLLDIRKESVKNNIFILSILLCGFITKPSFWPFIVPYIVYRSYKFLIKPKVNIVALLGADFQSRNLISSSILYAIPVVLLAVMTSTGLKNYSSYGKAFNLNCYLIYGSEKCKSDDTLGNTYRLIREKNIGSERLGIIDYYDDWIDLILERTFGVFGHKIMLLSKYESQILKGIFIVAFILLIYKLRGASVDIKVLLCLCVFYSSVVLLYVNYKGYLSHGQFDAGVHGRYLFPVLSCFVIMLVYALYSNWSKRIYQMGIAIPTLMFFVWLDLPSFTRDNVLPLMVVDPQISYSSRPIVEGESKGMRVTIDSYNGIVINDNDKLIKTNPLQKELIIKGWAIDEIDMTLGSKLIFKLSDSIMINAQYGLSREDVASAFKASNLINSGYSVLVPIKHFKVGQNYIEVLMIDNNEEVYSNSRIISVIHQE